MSHIGYANPAAPAPPIGAPGDAGLDKQTLTRVRRATMLPLLISGGVNLFFFVQWWIPETASFPARHWWLHQLAPLASTTLTSGGHPQIAEQDGRPGIFGLILLLAALAIPVLARSRHWLGRRAIAVPLAAGVIAGCGIVIGVLVSGRLGSAAFSVLLVAVWLAAAGYAGLHRIVFDLAEDRPKSWRSGLPLLAAYALIGPIPTAVGRWLFAPTLRDTAADLQHNEVALRLAALWTPITAALYVCGVLAAIAVWLAFEWWPPRRDLTFVALSLILVGVLVTTAAIGWPTTTAAARRATMLRYASPAQQMSFPCGAVRLDQPDPAQLPQPALTLVSSGFTCKRLIVYRGYLQTDSWSLPFGTSPLKASRPGGAKITGHPVVARYGDVVVVGGSDKIDGSLNGLAGVDLRRSGDLLWQYRCGPGRAFQVRFARVPGGDNPAQGFATTARESSPTVVVDCEGKPVLFDPAQGPR